MDRSSTFFFALPRTVALGVWFAVLGVLAGCAGRAPVDDVGPAEDSGLTEGGIIREDASVEDTSAADASLDAPPDLCSATCDPRGDARCPGGALRCILSSAEPMCAAPGTIPPGGACETTEACGPGHACFRATRTTGGVCAAICCPGAPETCGTGARCGGDGLLVDGTATRWGRCVLPRSCDVLSPELSCEAREGCYIVDGMGRTECRLAGTGAAGDICVLPEDCGPNLFCGGLGERTCLRVCSLSTPRACTDTERCVAQSYSPDGSGICIESLTPRP